MSINVTEYLGNLEQEKIAKRWDYLHRYKLLYVNDKNGRWPSLLTKNDVKKVFLPHSSQYVWVKRFTKGDFKIIDRNIVNEILISRIYNSLGVNAIKTYPCFFIDPKIQQSNLSRKVLGVCSKDLRSVEGLDVDILDADYRVDFVKYFNKSLDGMFSNRKKFIKVERQLNSNAELLYDRIVATYILDIIMLLADNHMGNKFVIAKKNEGNEDIVTFDFEDNNLNNDDFYNNQEGFQNCIIPQSRFMVIEECESLRDRLEYIRKLYLNGKLPDDCVSLLNKLQEFNLDELIRSTERETGYPISKSKQVDRIRKLVDYNQEFMAR